MSTRVVLAAITAVALALRLAHVVAVVELQTGNAAPGLDRWLALQIAKDVAEGDLSGGPFAHYESSPTYSVLLGLVQSVGGASLLLPLVLQALVGALAPACLFVALRGLSSERAGLAGAALAAFYDPAIFHEGLTLKFALIPTCVSALLAGIVVSRRHLGAAVGAGSAQTLLMALRPNSMLGLPVVLAWILWRPSRPRAGVLAAFAMGAFVVALPAGVRRLVAAEHGQASSLWGIHFYVGTVLDGTGGYRVVPGIADDVFGHVDDARTLAETTLGRPLDTGEVSRFWFDQGMALIRAHPREYLALEGRKLLRVLSAREDDVLGENMDRFRLGSPILSAGLVSFGVILPLAVIGTLAAALDRSAVLWAAALASSYALSLLTFFVTGRYRLAVAPPLIVCAGHALGWLTGSRSRSLVAAVAAVGLASIVPDHQPKDVVWVAGIVASAVLAGMVERRRGGHST